MSGIGNCLAVCETIAAATPRLQASLNEPELATPIIDYYVVYRK